MRYMDPMRRCVVFLLGVWLRAAVGLAQPQPAGAARVLLVPPAGVDDDAQIQALYAACRAIGLRVVDEEERQGVDLSYDPQDLVLRHPDDVRAALVEAKSAWKNLDVDAVQAHLEGALQGYLRLEHPENQRELLIDLLLFRAELALARGSSRQAIADLRLLARVDPQRLALHPGLYPPDLVDAYDAARLKNAQAGLGTLTVEARISSSGPRMFRVDQQIQSLGTLQVPEGPHLLSVQAPGARSWTEVVDVVSAHPVERDVFLAPPEAAARRAAARLRLFDAPDQAAPWATTLMETTGADVVVSLGQPQWVFQSQLSSPRPLPKTTHPAAFAAALSQLLTASATAGAVGTSSTQADLLPALGAGEETFLWVGATTLVGLAVGGAIATYYLWPAAEIAPPARPWVITCCHAGSP